MGLFSLYSLFIISFPSWNSYTNFRHRYHVCNYQLFLSLSQINSQIPSFHICCKFSFSLFFQIFCFESCFTYLYWIFIQLGQTQSNLLQHILHKILRRFFLNQVRIVKDYLYRKFKEYMCRRFNHIWNS